MKQAVLSALSLGAALAVLAACSASTSMEADDFEPSAESTASQALTTTKSGSVAKGFWKHFGPFSAAAGTFGAAMTGTGDADLYVRRGAPPTESMYDCRPYKDGSSESCSFVLSAPTDVYVSVYGEGIGTSSFNLTLIYEPPSLNVVTVTETGSVGASEWDNFSFSAPAGEFRVNMTGTGDADLYVRRGAPPNISSYDCRPYRGDSFESCVLNLTAPADVYVSVRGYASSSYYQLSVTYPKTHLVVPWPIGTSGAN